MLIYFEGLSYIFNIINIYKQYIFQYYMFILLFVMFIPITINGIVLYLLYKVESQGSISISKYSPNILKRSIQFLIRLGRNKESLDAFKLRCRSELSFYLILLF